MTTARRTLTITIPDRLILPEIYADIKARGGKIEAVFVPPAPVESSRALADHPFIDTCWTGCEPGTHSMCGLGGCYGTREEHPAAPTVDREARR